MNLARWAAKLFGLAGRRPAPRSAVVGEWGESRAAGFLKAAGWTIVGRNVRPDRRDEIDIIARRGETLIFVEVKTRGSEAFGGPIAAVDRRKRHALNRAAAAYLRRAGHPDLFYRFDVVEVVGQPEAGAPVIRHIEGAVPFERRLVFPV